MPDNKSQDPQILQDLIEELEVEARVHASQENFGRALMLLVESQTLSEGLAPEHQSGR
jgi:hypothetical protein